MIKGFLALDESLASSIALRYASWLVGVMPLQLRAGHVESPGAAARGVGTGWVRRTWEEALKESGRRAVQRLLLTEKVACPFVGAPKVFIGERDKEFLGELRDGDYQIFVEGNLNSSDVDEFDKLISSPLYANTPCSIMVVKNLVAGKKVALLCGDGVDHNAIMPVALDLLCGKGLVFDVFAYRHGQRHERRERHERHERRDAAPLAGGSRADESPAGGGRADEPAKVDDGLLEVGEMLHRKGLEVGECRVLGGPPASVAAMLGKYSVVAGAFPEGQKTWLELFAQCPSPVLLCK